MTIMIPLCKETTLLEGRQWKKYRHEDFEIPDQPSGTKLIELQPEGTICGENYLELYIEDEDNLYSQCNDKATVTWKQTPDDYDYFLFEVKWKGPDEACPCGIKTALMVGNVTLNPLWFDVTWAGGKLEWLCHRESLPCPGERLYVYISVPNANKPNGQTYAVGLNEPAMCVPIGDGYPGVVNSFTSDPGYGLIYAGDTHFETPVWTGGFVEGFYTDSVGWIEGNDHVGECPESHNAIPDGSLVYNVRFRGNEYQTVTSNDFAGYGIGDFVLLRKIGNQHQEPFDSEILDSEAGSLIIVPWRYPF